MTTDSSVTEGSAVDSENADSRNTRNADPCVPPSTQTRFRFYEPQAFVEKEDQNTNRSRFSFYDDTTRQELAAVENNITVATRIIGRGSGGAAPSNSTASAQRSSAASLAGSTDDILRSLQETEEQRLQILSTGGQRDVVRGGEAPAGNNVEDVETSSNPYEDAIKEALNLLRKHRSPPVTPVVDSTRTKPFPPMVDVDSSNAAYATSRARTPREQDRLLQHRMDDEDQVVVISDSEYVVSGGQGEDTASNSVSGMTNPAKASPSVVNDLTGAYEEHKLKAKQRQERMAQYASRLQEFKSSLQVDTAEQNWPPPLANSHSNVESYVAAPSGIGGGYLAQDMANIPHVASHNEDSVGFSDLSHSTKEQVEAEVQRGVERVLLAILERANASRGRASANGSEGDGSTKMSASVSGSVTQNNSTAGSSMSDALLRAMDELGLGRVSRATSGDDYSSSTKNEQLNLKTKTSVETAGTGTASRRSATSVVDELLAENDTSQDMEEEEEDIDTEKPSNHALVSSITSPASTSQPHFSQTWGLREEKKLPDSQEKSVQSPYDTIREEDEEAEAERLMQECLRDDSREDDGECETYEGEESSHSEAPHMQGVLGPLSKKAGGTTGVVLDLEQDDAESGQDADRRDADSKAQYSGPFSSVMKYVSSALTPEQEEEEAKLLAQYISSGQANDSEEKEEEDEDDDDEDSDQDDDDMEAMELMRTLCAHLLPFGVDQQPNRLLDAIPDWDETNPNEAGYRIIRLSKSQLRRVERAFETMINGLKFTSEQQLNGVEETGDAKFVKELQEAERLLDESEENQVKLANSTKARKTDKGALPPSRKAAVDTVVHADDDPEDCHPLFPGVKTTGKGEMGDLEFFHLPIIFKSHVTGFEPTKDLVLEPGNVVAGQYLVESELGSAAFSTAYRCIDLSSDGEDGHEEVCLKVIKNTKDFFDQSLDEIKILELLRQTGKVHQNHIVEMKCFFYYREHLVIVTELLRQNLFEFGKFILDNNEEPYFTIPRLAYITRQALISLRFVHSLGLVHSDVKPENILLGSYSRAQIKLIDFGSSCYLTDRQSSYIQSRSYRAPEVVLGLPYDGKIDVWSLGCVVSEMYTGEVTFQNDSIVSMLSRIEAICGPFPRHMIAQGRQSGQFFTKSGLLYEVVDDSEGDGSKTAPGPQDDEEDEVNAAMQFDIFQPKNTQLSSRLGFDPDLMHDFTEESYNSKPKDPVRHEQQMFTDFVRKLLTIDPDGRPSAEEALQHPWMLYAATLKEENIKYPSS